MNGVLITGCLVALVLLLPLVLIMMKDDALGRVAGANAPANPREAGTSGDCPHCRSQVVHMTNWCPACGNRVDVGGAAGQVAERDDRSRSKVGQWAVVVGLLLFGVLLIFNFIRDDRAAQEASDQALRDLANAPSTTFGWTSSAESAFLEGCRKGDPSADCACQFRAIKGSYTESIWESFEQEYLATGELPPPWPA